VEQFEDIQAISAGVGVTYSLNINQKDVDKCPQKEAIFRTIRLWEDAREANAFPRHIRKQLSDPAKNWSLEARDMDTWVLYRKIKGEKTGPVILSRAEGY